MPDLIIPRRPRLFSRRFLPPLNLRRLIPRWRIPSGRRLPRQFFAPQAIAGNVQFGPGGSVLFGPGGSVAMDPSCCCGPPPGCDCATLTITFTETSIPTGCIDDVRYAAQHFKSVAAADYDGSFTLDKIGDCTWFGEFASPVQFGFYGTAGCTGSPDHVAATLRIQVWQVDHGWQVFAFVYYTDPSGEAYVLFGSDSGTAFEVAELATADNIDCHDVGTDLDPIPNPMTDIQFDHEKYGIPSGGVATLAFP